MRIRRRLIAIFNLPPCVFASSSLCAKQVSNMLRSQSSLWASIACLIALTWGPDHTDAQELPYAQLPAIVKGYVEEVRQTCREVEPDLKLSHDLTGIDQVFLDRNGTRGIIVRNSGVCLPLNTSGANCTNHACELTIWRQDRRKGWEKLLQESSHREYVLLENRTSRLKFIVLSLWA